MSTEAVRAGSAWLALREPADSAARSTELLDAIAASLPRDGVRAIHDLGCGTGSMLRWLAPRLPGPQQWVLYDRDAELLELAAAAAPVEAADGAPVSVEARLRDITRLDADELASGDLLTASALLDMMTGSELRRMVARCAEPGCAVLFTLTVIGRVELGPADPLDSRIAEAFNAHQRRPNGAERRLGPDAVGAAVEAFTRHGFEVEVRPSPWLLGAEHSELIVEWLRGWLTAACEEQPELALLTPAYARRRLAEAEAGRLSVAVHHQDLLARPR